MFEIWGPLWFGIICLLIYAYNRYILHSPEYELQSSQVKFFYTGVILLYILQGSPFTIIADHYLFSAHMVQISVSYFVVVPLIIVGLPFKWFKKYAWNYKLRTFIKIAGHPWVTLAVFNILFTVYFVPTIFNVIHGNVVLSTFYQLLMFLYGFFMWWSIMNPVRRVNELGPLVRIAYVFFASLALMPIGFFFLLVPTAHYSVFQATAGEIFPLMTAVYDQQLSGGILKIVQLSSFSIVMFKIVKSWVWREEDEGHAYNKNVRVVQGIAIQKDDKDK
ncbi:MAG TPA: cytochrome c oxidase assembly protein [Bacillota bacterium]|nr:cytochrome c oxidase assembly protein [Bacillota bacterium]